MNKKYVMFGFVFGVLLLVSILLIATKQTKARDIIEIKELDGVTTKVLEDKVINYTSATQELKISNADGLKEEIISIKLDTPLDYQVGLGYQKVAQITVSPKTDINSFIKKIELYNIKDNAKSIARTIDYKYLSIGTKKVIDYTTKCSDSEISSKNGTKDQDCKTIESGSHYEDEWLPYTGELKSDTPITLGLFTDVKIGDKIEWIPTFNISGTDVKVPEWATWTGNMSVGLVSYYKFDEPSGTVAIDSLNLNNATIQAVTINQAGKIGQGYLFDGTNTDLVYDDTFTFGGSGSVAKSICFWSKAAGATGVAVGIGNASRGNNFGITAGTDYTHVYGWEAGKDWLSPAGTGRVANQWAFTCVTYNPSGTTTKIYINGSEKASTTSYTFSTPASPLLVMGNEIDKAGISFNGYLDEVSIFNRTLSATEVNLLYHNNTGCSYGNETCYPVQCTFSGYVKDASSNGLESSQIVIFNQDNKSEVYNTTTDVNGLWSINITNSTKNFTAVAYLNNTLIGQAKPFISGIC